MVVYIFAKQLIGYAFYGFQLAAGLRSGQKKTEPNKKGTLMHKTVNAGVSCFVQRFCMYGHKHGDPHIKKTIVVL